MFVKPLDGLLIRDPRTRVPLPLEGAEVPEISFWLRRLRDKSIAVSKPEAASAPASPERKPG